MIIYHFKHSISETTVTLLMVGVDPRSDRCAKHKTYIKIKTPKYLENAIHQL